MCTPLKGDNVSNMAEILDPVTEEVDDSLTLQLVRIYTKTTECVILIHLYMKMFHSTQYASLKWVT